MCVEWGCTHGRHAAAARIWRGARNAVTTDHARARAAASPPPPPSAPPLRQPAARRHRPLRGPPCGAGGGACGRKRLLRVCVRAAARVVQRRAASVAAGLCAAPSSGTERVHQAARKPVARSQDGRGGRWESWRAFSTSVFAQQIEARSYNVSNAKQPVPPGDLPSQPAVSLAQLLAPPGRGTGAKGARHNATCRHGSSSTPAASRRGAARGRGRCAAAAPPTAAGFISWLAQPPVAAATVKVSRSNHHHQQQP